MTSNASHNRDVPQPFPDGMQALMSMTQPQSPFDAPRKGRLTVPGWLVAVAATILVTGGAAVTTIRAQDAGHLTAPLRSGVDREALSKDVTAAENFFDYVNGSWLAQTSIPADQATWGAFIELRERTKENVRTVIEQAAAAVAKPGGGQPTTPANVDAPSKVADDSGAADSKTVEQVGSLFLSFMDMPRRNERGIEPIRPLIERVKQVQNRSDWIQLAGELSRLGVENPLGYYVEPDAKNSSQYAAYIVQAGLTLPDRDYYLEDEPQFVEARTAMRKYLEALLEQVDWPDRDKAIAAVMDFEFKVARAQWTNTRLRDPQENYNPSTVEEFGQKHPQLDWTRYSQAVDLPVAGKIVIGQPSYFDELTKIVEATDIETLRAYLAFHTLDQFADVLDEENRQLHFDFHSRTLSGVDEMPELWKDGVELSNALLGMPVGQLYVEKYFPPASKARMEELVANLIAAFEIRIGELTWMGEGTKQRAVEKLKLIGIKIGYPDQWRDYSSLELDAGDLMGNVLAIMEFEHQYQLAKVNKPVDRSEWLMPPQTVNAYYDPLKNEIVFPAGILQPPFFDQTADDAINYGAIGAVIGHEISHAFDDSGSQFDGHGNLVNWWTEQDRQEFEKRASKLKEQYSRYEPLPGNFVNGELTLGENIGDLGGLSTAWTAYQLSQKQHPSPEIDGFTGPERFFIGWAQVWRSLYREAEALRRLRTDPHSPPRYRTNGIVSNVDAFYETFGVDPDDAMFIAPEQRVQIW